MPFRTDLSKVMPHLMTLRWFANLPPHVRDKLMAAAKVRTCSQGARLFAVGDAFDGIYCLLKGVIGFETMSENGRSVVATDISLPNWFGEISLFDNAPREFDAIARKPVTVLFVSKEALEALLQEEPVFWRHIGALLAGKARLCAQRIQELTSLSARARVARRLLGLATVEGMYALPSTEQIPTPLVNRSVRISQEQLAVHLGLSRQTVHEILKVFEVLGMIQRQHGALELLDWDLLRKASLDL